ncbi:MULTISPECIES: UDP-N-acetylmuramoyl-L-alanyl-D-glutamate--2,6-diaminopimelate ligase [Vitreoscilla]|uniref:UDP-N-acetylmuramoyl-L-alanyl-D-glutamate--2,6-diaminopimelate ligase n=1 Tax=Vitreoscilla stercoraria TaxID=61 RepID=A0ABY4EFJ0_VITST|nr:MULTISPECIES: UDP-N-acetylmuramoyl-L-alanyl-D-glutamate--2,6-diaminopimelate ligase [Vitreoscilla]UOO93675.1 UDP-N-acetylmuramoyl-L-alanyl-D-glutamate--2,6-diaminopimelate ligase [Vitreoscilla stercoraria]
MPVRVVIDSRQLQAGEVFLACPGEYTDGRDFIQAALNRGAAAVLWDTEGGFEWTFGDAPNLGIEHLRQYMGVIAADALSYPGRQLDVIGVTGTNGKTSITQWLAQALDQLQTPCGIMGTVGNGFWQQLEQSTHTTLDAWSVQQWLQRFVNEGAKAVAMEVSSHGLDQFRVNGVPFTSAIFTNLTRDHLDYHGDMQSYGDIKSRLFFWHHLQHAIINIDDEFGVSLLQQIQANTPSTQAYAYGFSEQADVCIVAYQPSLDGTQIDFRTPWGDVTIHTQLIGRFNAQNLAACVAVLGAQGYALADIASVLGKIQPATGRMDGIRETGKPLVVIDYAHTPDALEKALATLHELKQAHSQVWCVFGCGGNRDKGKRPLMGAAANQYADKVVLTSDNPRLEVPQDILNDILPALERPEYVTIERAEAIEYAIAHAGADDIVLIAGKGHETYQDMGGVKNHFSDFECARAALAQRQ